MTETLADDTFSWMPATSAPTLSTVKALETTDAADHDIVTFAHGEETAADYTATVVGRCDDGRHFAVDLRYTLSNADATYTDLRSPTASDPLPMGSRRPSETSRGRSCRTTPAEHGSSSPTAPVETPPTPTTASRSPTAFSA